MSSYRVAGRRGQGQEKRCCTETVVLAVNMPNSSFLRMLFVLFFVSLVALADHGWSFSSLSSFVFRQTVNTVDVVSASSIKARSRTGKTQVTLLVLFIVLGKVGII